MKPTNLTIKDFFTVGAKLTFFLGAGCSVDAPSSLADGETIMKAIIKFATPKSEWNTILRIIFLLENF